MTIGYDPLQTHIDMPAVFSDAEIARLISDPKHLPLDWRTRINLRPKRGHKEQQIDLTGESGSEYRIILRQSSLNQLDFSAILAVRLPSSNRFFRLRRYNGKSHQHTNQIEGDSFYDFHIHMATKRYQDIGEREDAYAETTNRYGNLTEAIGCMQQDVSLITPKNDQLGLV